MDYQRWGHNSYTRLSFCLLFVQQLPVHLHAESHSYEQRLLLHGLVESLSFGRQLLLIYRIESQLASTGHQDHHVYRDFLNAFHQYNHHNTADCNALNAGIECCIFLLRYKNTVHKSIHSSLDIRIDLLDHHLQFQRCNLDQACG